VDCGARRVSEKYANGPMVIKGTVALSHQYEQFGRKVRVIAFAPVDAKHEQLILEYVD
jgi:hypothetical protein